MKGDRQPYKPNQQMDFMQLQMSWRLYNRLVWQRAWGWEHSFKLAHQGWPLQGDDTWAETWMISASDIKIWVSSVVSRGPEDLHFYYRLCIKTQWSKNSKLNFLKKERPLFLPVANWFLANCIPPKAAQLFTHSGQVFTIELGMFLFTPAVHS